MQQEIYEWTGGAFVHTHTRIEDELTEENTAGLSPDMAEYMHRYNDGSMSLHALTYYLDAIFDKRIPITDTQHPSYILHPEYDDLADADKIRFFRPEVIEATVDLLSECIIERARIVRQATGLQHVYTGVEVDMLSPDGKLSVHDEALAQLDYVTCSYHSSLWRAAGNADPTKNDCLSAYTRALDNPHVDTLSHPTINLPPEAKARMTAADWTELLQHMKQKQVAFEVNLDSTNLILNKGYNLDAALVQHALSEEVPIVIGFDFHYPHDWGCYPSPRLVQKQDAPGLYAEHLDNGSVSRLLARVLGNIYALRQLGLQPADITNSTPSRFTHWLDSRRVSS